MAKHQWTAPWHYDRYLAVLENPEPPRWAMLEELDVGKDSFSGAGQAWIVKDAANDVTCLQSYATIVSVYLGEGQVRDLGTWSRTTSRHQARFRAHMADRD